LEREIKTFKQIMEKLKTNYLGLSLKSPLIVGSSRLTSTLGHLREAEVNGAGAVVLKSLFEEQILHHISTIPSSMDYPEADEYISYYTRSHSVEEYLDLIKSAKKDLTIPVIPSINCFSPKGWTDFARNIEDAGADAIEINMFFLPGNRKMSSEDSENVYFELIENLKASVSIPVAIKIGYRFSNILYMIDQFYMRGVEGVVMFNRFYEPDIDVNRMEIVPAPVFSNEGDRRYVLRWVAMTSAQDIEIDISASTGVHSGDDAIRYLLAGADTVQLCSVLYRGGFGVLKQINERILQWMKQKGFSSLDDFRGKLNWANYNKPTVFERTQFMKYFSAID
jgi:dihydroorotate dehydrogenase (fumarate)